MSKIKNIRESTHHLPIKIDTFCEICKSWKPVNQFPYLINNARAKIICIDCLVDRKWRWLKHNVSTKHYWFVAKAKMAKEGGFVA